jgi:hypothetical protein
VTEACSAGRSGVNTTTASAVIALSPEASVLRLSRLSSLTRLGSESFHASRDEAFAIIAFDKHETGGQPRLV